MSKNNGTSRIPNVRDTIRPRAGRYVPSIQRLNDQGVCYWSGLTVDGWQTVEDHGYFRGCMLCGDMSPVDTSCVLASDLLAYVEAEARAHRCAPDAYADLLELAELVDAGTIELRS